jgi:hypothetical protein
MVRDGQTYLSCGAVYLFPTDKPTVGSVSPQQHPPTAQKFKQTMVPREYQLHATRLPIRTNCAPTRTQRTISRLSLRPSSTPLIRSPPSLYMLYAITNSSENGAIKR